MDARRFDLISKAFGNQLLSRRQTVDATPEPVFDPAQKAEFLFVLTFQAGNIPPIAGVDGRYALTLEPGTGQTVYFSDRPER